jgi:hypothetical protein
MELDLQSLFDLHVHSCTHWLRPRNPLPRIYERGRHWSAQDRRYLLKAHKNENFLAPILNFVLFQC